MNRKLPDTIEFRLENGNTLLCGPGENCQWGGFVQVLDFNGEELGYWDKEEWGCCPELVMGAIFSIANGQKIPGK